MGPFSRLRTTKRPPSFSSIKHIFASTRQRPTQPVIEDSTLDFRPEPGVNFRLCELPTEIISEICRSLCLHCRHERIGELPEEDIAEGIQDQLSLAHLSRCSTQMREIAQPILFHFFACLQAQVATRNRLAAFIHTLFWRPDLASSVRSLVLWSPTYWRDSNQKISALGDQDETFNLAVKRLGPSWEGRPYKLLFDLHELAMALAPRVNYVLLHCSFKVESPSKTWPDWPHTLEQNLKHLVLVDKRTGSYRSPGHFYMGDVINLIKHMPSLESLAVVDCCGDDLLPSSKETRAPHLPRLKKLSISGSNISCQVIKTLIQQSKSFEDLEFLHEYYDEENEELEEFDPDRDLGTAKTTLKRLCYSVFPGRPELNEVRFPRRNRHAPSLGGRRSAHPIFVPDGEEGYDPFDPNGDSCSTFKTGWSLHEFSALETIEIEQLVLYGQIFPSPGVSMRERGPDHSRELVSTGEFFAKLPSGMRHLRIGCLFSWGIVFRDLMALAEEQQGRFPRLRSVTLDLRKKPPQGEHDTLVRVYQSAGVGLIMQYVGRSYSDRGLLPAAPGCSEVIPGLVCGSY